MEKTFIAIYFFKIGNLLNYRKNKRQIIGQVGISFAINAASTRPLSGVHAG